MQATSEFLDNQPLPHPAQGHHRRGPHFGERVRLRRAQHAIRLAAPPAPAKFQSGQGRQPHRRLRILEQRQGRRRLVAHRLPKRFTSGTCRHAASSSGQCVRAANRLATLRRAPNPGAPVHKRKRGEQPCRQQHQQPEDYQGKRVARPRQPKARGGGQARHRRQRRAVADRRRRAATAPQSARKRRPRPKARPAPARGPPRPSAPAFPRAGTGPVRRTVRRPAENPRSEAAYVMTWGIP